MILYIKFQIQIIYYCMLSLLKLIFKNLTYIFSIFFVLFSYVVCDKNRKKIFTIRVDREKHLNDLILISFKDIIYIII